MAKEVIFVADDFGMNDEINLSIIHAHRAGCLSAAALMMGQPGTSDAIALARENPALDIGWHLHLNDSVPATMDRWPWGASPVRAGFSIGLSRKSRELMVGEVARQWELFCESGLECRFINSHHHLHTHPLVYRTLRQLIGPRFEGWIRLGRPRAFRASSVSMLWSVLDWALLEKRRKLSSWRATDTLWGLDRVFRMQAGEIHAILATLPEGFHEFLFHPRTLSSPDTLCLVELKSLLSSC